MLTRGSLSLHEHQIILDNRSKIGYLPCPHHNHETVATCRHRYRADKLGYIYRLVVLPPLIGTLLPVPMRLLTQTEWATLGVTMSDGWEHFWSPDNSPVPTLAFRRKLTENELMSG
eukprot:PhM_4_TR15357/c0_g2_i1/m.42121/K02219/CKS1; cyclin-dependent kinase regulatory subunit CKS1